MVNSLQHLYGNPLLISVSYSKYVQSSAIINYNKDAILSQLSTLGHANHPKNEDKALNAKMNVANN